ncbi:hypothetical protein KJ854_04885 [Patescibacteria group bacterium]|nr:hypothetical protein [Patescibacteria group bacterium]
MEKKIGFSINKLIIDDDIFDLDFFNKIDSKDKNKQVIAEEVISINAFEKETIEDRFISIYFEGWDKYPYSSKVIKADSKNLDEIDNPRAPNEIELNDQFFILIDVKTQRIYISNQNKVKSTIDWISDKTKSKVTIKPLFEESNFIEKVRSINEINFSIETENLFNSARAGLLSNELARDMNGFKADESKLSMIYKKSKPIDQIKEIVKKIIGAKINYKTLTIIGRMDNGVESILNLNGLVNRMLIDRPIEDETKKINKNEVFNALIIKIKQNENTN